MSKMLKQLSTKANTAIIKLAHSTKTFIQDETGGGGGDTHLTGLGYIVIAGVVITAVLLFVRAFMPTVFAWITDEFNKLMGQMSF